MLFLHHSNHLTHLVEILLSDMMSPQTDCLEPERVLVQNPGIKRWLQQQISRKTGIAANIDFPLPSRFIWDIFLSLFEDVSYLSAYDQEVLRWTLLRQLSQHENDPNLEPLQPYLKQDDNNLAAYQLACKLAALYDHYLVYRPQMIADWEQGKATSSRTESWQAYLWNRLRKNNPQPHRAELIKRLIDLLQSGQVNKSRLPQRLYVFALSAMSPLYMDVLAELGQHADVHIFILNPCEHYWGDLEDKKEKLRRGDISLPENELLASLGKQGREYIDQFYDRNYQYQDSFQFQAYVPDSLLKLVKNEILTLQPTLNRPRYESDSSIQIVSCYSEIRELQVLHDQLLQLLEQDESLQAHDIVVMCPDINTLSPYIEAVFGQQPENKRIPYSISDHDELSDSPLFQAILEWILLASNRLTVNQVLGWLELPALQRAYGFDKEALEIIRHWIQSSHIHWGLDQSHRQGLDLGNSRLNTWMHGLDQLLTAYIMNDATELFKDQCASETIISNAELHALGQLHKFLDDLKVWSEKLAQSTTLAQWQSSINQLIEKFLRLDEDEEWLVKTIRNEMADWQLQAEQGSFKQEVNATLIHYLLKNGISESMANHHYLSGGVNFCNLIPMRTLPFRIVCLIGMGEEQFPRAETPLQLDLIAMNPRKGDRSRREDDRYMFLQSLLSAQDVFYISYVGRNKRDDSDIEPSVVVSELIDYVEQSCGYRLPIIQTPLQAFSEKSFEMGSYAELWQHDRDYPTGQFNQEIPPREPEYYIELDEIIGFYKNPIRYFMQKRLNMDLYDESSAIDDEEPFTQEPLGKYKIIQKLLNDLFVNNAVQKEKYLNSGSLAQKNSGVLQFEELYEKAQEIYQHIRRHPTFDGTGYLDISQQVNNQHVTGRIISYSAKGLLDFSQSRLNGRQAFGWWIQHCFLCASEQSDSTEFLFKDGYNNIKKGSFDILSKNVAEQLLQQLLDGFNQGMNRIWPLYIDSAFEYQKVGIKKDWQMARQHLLSLWGGDRFNYFSEAQDIYIQTSLKGREGFPDEFFELSEQYMSPLFDSWRETSW